MVMAANLVYRLIQHDNDMCVLCMGDNNEPLNISSILVLVLARIIIM